MKTMKSVLFVVAASAALTLTAADPLLTPRASENRTPAIKGSCCVKDPNLVAGLRLGKATPNVKLSTGAAVKDPNLLADAKCPMAPKAKGTTACKTM
jgi:hypothetical protein